MDLVIHQLLGWLLILTFVQQSFGRSQQGASNYHDRSGTIASLHVLGM